MAASLRFAADITADDAYDDVEHHGDEPVPQKMAWDRALLKLYARSTWNADGTWRRRTARGAAGRRAPTTTSPAISMPGVWPLPRCPAEQLALHALLVRLRDWLTERDVFFAELCEELEVLPQHHHDEDCDARGRTSPATRKNSAHTPKKTGTHRPRR